MVKNIGAIMSGQDPGALLMAEAFTALLREACDRESPYELDVVRRRGIDGEMRDVRIFPPRWMRRLELAHANGAFERMQVSDIVQRILVTDDPTLPQVERT